MPATFLGFDVDELEEIQMRITAVDFDAEELQASSQPKMPDFELALIAFSASNEGGIVVWHNHGHIERDIEEFGAHEIASWIIDKNAPDHGLAVWEGRISWVSGGSWESLEPEEPEYVTIKWREPDDEEWEAIKEHRNPFEPKPKIAEDNWGFGSKTSM
jgi:hypothetical protein